MANLLGDYSTTTGLKVFTKCQQPHFPELGEIDYNSGDQGREDVHDDPVPLALDLPVVVRSAHSQVSLNTHWYDDEYAGTEGQPGNFRVSFFHQS